MIINNNIDVGDTCDSKSGKKFVIKDRYTESRGACRNSMAIVEFIESGYITKVQIGAVRRGKVRDSSHIKEIVVGGKFKSNNYGEFTILEVKSSLAIKVQFLLTGYCTTSEASSIREGNVKDKLSPRIHGIGYIGDGKVKSKSLYGVWKCMLGRCYCTSHEGFSYYGGVGVTVCKEWHEYIVFEAWAFLQEYKKGWEIDKDIFSKGTPCYCPSVCVFVPRGINTLFKYKPNTTGLPVGVTPSRGKKSHYVATCTAIDGKRKSVHCRNVGDAKIAYASMKTEYVRFKVELYYSSGDLTQKVYDILKDYTYTHTSRTEGY